MIDIENDLEKILEPGKKPEEYLQTYLDLVEQYKPRGLDKSKVNFYTEIHHILPRCKGGTDDKENLVMLSFNEHLILHLLLFLSYPEIDSFAVAASLMLFGRTECKNNELVGIIKDFKNLKETIKIRTANSFMIPIVCYSLDNFTVLKTYKSLTEASNDGFSLSKLSAVLHGTRKQTGGYRWSSITEFCKMHEKEFIDFLNKTSGDKEIKLFPIKKELVLCLNEDYQILKVYSSPMSAEKIDKFDSRQISTVLVGKQKTSRYYYWMRENKYNELFPGKLDKFLLNHSVDDNTPIKVIKLTYRKVVCLDKNKNVITIYEYAKKIEEDLKRFGKNTISKNINLYINTDKMRSGYYWMYLDDFAVQYPEKLEEYYKTHEDERSQN